MKLWSKIPKQLIIPLILGLILWGANIENIISHWPPEDWSSELCLLLLTAIMWGQSFVKLSRHRPDQSTLLSRQIGWGALLIAMLLTLYWRNSFCFNLGVAIFMWAPISYFCGLAPAIFCAMPVLWNGFFIPMREDILLLLSYPLRVTATVISTQLLTWFDQPIISSATSMKLPDNELAITYSCSGIHQMDVFIVVAYLLAQQMQKKLRWQILHFMFLIVAIVLANSLRLVTVVLLYQLIGPDALGGFCHLVFGYLQIAVAMVLFYLIGLLLRYLTTTPAPVTPATEPQEVGK